VRKDWPWVLLIVVTVLLLAGHFWARVSAPCDTFKYTSVKDVPARCLMHR
jgi:hypothetical protein